MEPVLEEKCVKENLLEGEKEVSDMKRLFIVH